MLSPQPLNQVPVIIDNKPVLVDMVTESKLQEVAESNEYHDQTFLKFLKALKEEVKGDH